MTSKGNSTFKLKLSRHAEHYLRRADRTTQKRVAEALEAIRKNPFQGPNVKALEGPLEGDYRYEVGGLRIVYSVNVEISHIGPRGDIYKK